MFKRHYIALALVVVMVLVLFNLPSQTAAKFKLAISGLFFPLFSLAGSASQAAEKVGNAVIPRRDLVRQNEQLRLENEELRLRAAQAEEAFRENERLRQLLGWQKQQLARYKAARVIARDPANWWRTVQIDLGSRDGIRPNMPVRTLEGLVGKVSSVGATRSQVVLLGDPNLRVSAIVQETRETGIIYSGTANPLEHNIVDMGYLLRNSQLKPGHTVVTSGEGGVFPKGIPIGRVVESRSADYGLSTEARIKLFARMNAIEEVWVMFP